jgi:hypothetical protein
LVLQLNKSVNISNQKEINYIFLLNIEKESETLNHPSNGKSMSIFCSREET